MEKPINEFPSINQNSKTPDRFIVANGSFRIGKEKLIKVLYEDEAYIVFDKPAGLLVIPTPKNEPNTLVNIVNHQYAAAEGVPKLHPCHRLDRETSGVIVFAKGKHHQQLLMEAFQKRLVKKKYILFIHGRLKQPSGEIRNAIQDLDHRGYRPRGKGKSALTRFRVLQVKKKFTVVEAEPVTGRTNQIRIHFSQEGFPLVGDRKFSIASEYTLKFRRTALHAKSIEWVHPITRKLIKISSDLPEDMEVLLARS